MPADDPLKTFDKVLDSIYTNVLEVCAYIKYTMETFATKTAWAYFKTCLYLL